MLCLLLLAEVWMLLLREKKVTWMLCVLWQFSGAGRFVYEDELRAFVLCGVKLWRL